MKTLMTSFLLLIGALAPARASTNGYYATSVYVKFMSYGTGVDTRTLDRVKALILQGKSNGAVLSAVRRGVGREGEQVYCVQLREQGSRYAFIRDLAPSILRDGSDRPARTQVYVGFSCDDITKASLQDLSLFYP